MTITARNSRRIEKTLEVEKVEGTLIPSLRELLKSSPGERDRLLSAYKESTRNRITQQQMFGRRLSHLASLTTAITALVAWAVSIIPLLGK